MFYSSLVNEWQWVVSPDGTFDAAYTASYSDASPTGKTLFFVCSFDSTTGTRRLKVYNTSGTLLSNTTASSTSTSVYSNAQPFELGGLRNSGATSAPMDGMIDEFGAWGRLLTDEEVSWIINSGAGKTWGGVESAGIQSPSNDTKDFVKSLVLDGNSDYVTVADDATLQFPTGDFSVSVWFKRTGAGPDPTEEIIRKGNSTQEWWALGFDGSDYLRFFIDDGSDTAKADTAATTYADGLWHHAVAKRVGQTASLYVDGTLVDSDTGSNIDSIDDGGESLYLGAGFSSGVGVTGYLNGNIDDVKVYGRELSESEITALYNGESVDDTNLVLDLNFNDNVTDQSGNGNDGTLNGTAGYSENIVCTGEVLNTDTIAYYGLDEASDTRPDSTGNENHLTDNNGVGVREGVVSGLAEDNNDSIRLWLDSSGNGNDAEQTTVTSRPTLVESQSIELDGNSDYVNLGNDSSLDVTGAITISAWCRATSLGEEGYIFSKTNYTGSGGYGLLWEDSPRRLEFVYGNSNAVSSNTIIDDLEWHNAVITVDSSGNYVFYADGVEIGSGSGVTVTANSLDAYIGNRSGGSTAAHFFEGFLDDVRLFDRALSASEVLALSQGTDITSGLISHWKLDGDADDGVGSNDGTLVGTAGYSSNIPSELQDGARRAVLFDGTDDRFPFSSALLSTSDGAEPYSCFIWMKTTSTTPADKGLFTQYDGAINADRFVFGVRVGEIEYTKPGRSIDIETTGAALNDGEFYLVGFVKKADGTVTLYKDSVSTGTTGSDTHPYQDTVTSLGESSLEWDGEVGDVFLSNSELSQADITNFYNATRAYYGK